jgi:hypothetical protein
MRLKPLFSRPLFAGVIFFSSQFVTADTILPNVGVIPELEQNLTIQGSQVELELAPVFGDKDWALTARWDDNNQNSLNMHQSMAAIGLKGTFYLNDSTGNAAGAFARKLSEDGCSIGGHTQNHNFLPHLSANRMFREILLNRIVREADTDRAINSFAFPYGRYKDERAPLAFERITNAWLRSGYHHNVYENFILKNPYMPVNYASTGNQIYAGDRVIEPEKFHAQMNRILDAPEKYKIKAPTISMGVHTWQPAAELVKFEELVSEYTKRNDFWLCNQTELAAYRFQVAQTRFEPLNDERGQSFRVTRPTAAYAGDSIALTVRLIGPRPDSVLFDGESLQLQATEDPMVWLVDLPYPADQGGPSLIDWNTNGPGFLKTHHADEFSDLDFSLDLRADGVWLVTLDNQGDEALRDLFITLRLPLLYEQGVVNRLIDLLPAGESIILEFKVDPIENDPTLLDGAIFAAAQIDFLSQDGRGRIYSVYQGDMNSDLVSCIRDMSFVAGPFPEDSIQVEQLLKSSQLGHELSPLDESPLGVWRRAPAESRSEFAQSRFMTYSDVGKWRRAAIEYKRKPSQVLVAVEFTLPEESAVLIDSERTIAFVCIDGEEVSLTKLSTSSLAPGAHRIILCLNTEKRMSFSQEEPQYLSLKVKGQAITEFRAPQWDLASK